MLKLMLIFDIFRITIQIQDLSLKKLEKKPSPFLTLEVLYHYNHQ